MSVNRSSIRRSLVIMGKAQRDDQLLLANAIFYLDQLNV